MVDPQEILYPHSADRALLQGLAAFYADAVMVAGQGHAVLGVRKANCAAVLCCSLRILSERQLA